jgi:hypothetical protein
MSQCCDLLGTVVANDPHLLSHVRCLPCKIQPSIYIGWRLYVSTVTEQSSVACIHEFLLMCPTTEKNLDFPVLYLIRNAVVSVHQCFNCVYSLATT